MSAWRLSRRLSSSVAYSLRRNFVPPNEGGAVAVGSVIWGPVKLSPGFSLASRKCTSGLRQDRQKKTKEEADNNKNMLKRDSGRRRPQWLRFVIWTWEGCLQLERLWRFLNYSFIYVRTNISKRLRLFLAVRQHSNSHKVIYVSLEERKKNAFFRNVLFFLNIFYPSFRLDSFIVAIISSVEFRRFSHNNLCVFQRTVAVSIAATLLRWNSQFTSIFTLAKMIIFFGVETNKSWNRPKIPSFFCFPGPQRRNAVHAEIFPSLLLSSLFVLMGRHNNRLSHHFEKWNVCLSVCLSVIAVECEMSLHARLCTACARE